MKTICWYISGRR